MSQEVGKGTFVIKAVLRKDFLQLWPIVALAAALLFLRNMLFPLLTAPMSGLRTAVEIANGLACCTLLVAVIQQDALTGVRHDWLTRPITRGRLFAAKAIFIIVAITVPADLSLVVGSLLSGHSLSEALVEGTEFSLNWIGPLLILAALATLSDTLLKAAGTVLAVTTFAALAVPITMRLGPDNELIYGWGIGWITESIHFLVLLAASAAILWIQYSQRDMRRSIAIAVIATVLAVCGPLLLTQRQVFGVQKLFSSAAEEQKIVTKLAPGCFPLAGPDEPPIWIPGLSDYVGPNPLGFTTTLEVKVPQGSHVIVGASRLSYVDADGRELTTLKPVLARAPVRAPGSSTNTDHWLLPRATYEKLVAERANARLMYSASLLEPALSADIAADGSRRYIEGLGFCGARVRTTEPGAGRTVNVDCLKHGAQPALIAVAVKGEADNGHNETAVSFRPWWLELLTVQRWHQEIWSKQPSTVPTVIVTAFEARAHVDRTFTVPGVLGGEQCTR